MKTHYLILGCYLGRMRNVCEEFIYEVQGVEKLVTCRPCKRIIRRDNRKRKP